MGVTPLDHCDRRFTDGEDVSGLHQVAGVVTQHVDGVVERSEQMGFQREHRTAIAGSERCGLLLQHCRSTQGNHHSFAARQTAEGAVVDPVHFHPDGVDPAGNVAAVAVAEAHVDLNACALVPLDDVSGPVAVRSCFFVRVMRRDRAANHDVAEITAADQHRLDLQFRNEDLHPLMGVGDLQPTGELKVATGLIHPPVHLADREWRRGPQPVPRFDPQHTESKQ